MIFQLTSIYAYIMVFEILIFEISKFNFILVNAIAYLSKMSLSAYDIPLDFKELEIYLQVAA